MIEKIMELIKREITIVSRKEEYDGYKIFIANEQQFAKLKNKESNAIYLVVKFMQASLNYGQTLLPATITAVSENNKSEIVQKLLLDFAETYNLTTNDDSDITQAFTSPVAIQNFAEIYSGYRSVYQISCSFLVVENANPYEVMFRNENTSSNGEKIPAISVAVDWSNQLETQPYFNSENFTRSTGKYATLTVSITLNLTRNEFCGDILAVIYKDFEKCPKGVDTEFGLLIKHLDGTKFLGNFKLVNVSTQKNVGEIQPIVATFTL